MTLYLVRHGRPVIDPETPAHTWPLDPEGHAQVHALRSRLPRRDTRWYSSPEAKAVQTAQLLTERPVQVVEDLREIERPTPVWSDDFAEVVRRTLADPDAEPVPGWESANSCRARLLDAVIGLLPGKNEHVVLVGHGTAWTILTAALTGTTPDLRRWQALAMPDVIRVEHRNWRLPSG